MSAPITMWRAGLGRGGRVMQEQLWIGAGALAAIAVASGYAQHRRNKRTDMDRVGIVPWPFVQMMAFLGAVIAASIALHTGS
jgi:hypothetical protein